MSQWTHVAGIIRIDSMAGILSADTIKLTLKALMGTPVTYEDLMGDDIETHVPMGSEGSLQYEIVKTRDENGLPWGHVAVWGDLRDYTDVEAIKVWFQEWIAALCAETPSFIRSAVVTVRVEGGEDIIFDHKTLGALLPDIKEE